jgi:hypothetical protein
VLSELPILGGIEEVLQDIYTFFCKSPKKHQAFVKLADFLETKGNKILLNIKTRWMSILAPVVRVMNEFKPLLVKMNENATVRKPKALAVKCWLHLTDVKVVVGMACLMPMLHLANKLMKLAQCNDVYVCDYLTVVKKLQLDLNQMYIDPATMFSHEQFWDFNALIEARHDAIPLKWMTDELDLNSLGVEFLAFDPKGTTIPCIYQDPVAKQTFPVTREVYRHIVDSVKEQASSN